jgi:L-ascorbate oxidase
MKSSKSMASAKASYWLRPASLAAMLVLGAETALGAAFVEPTVFASSNGTLDLLMIARPKPIAAIAFNPPGAAGPINPIGWVYEVCKRPPSGNACPAGAGTVADYGGVRLALQKGDTLRIRLVNRLPAMDPTKVKHEGDPGQANLYRNPTNIHTHGLIVPARAATVKDPTFGDFVFVTAYNSANGVPVPQQTHQHGAIVMDTIDYRIDIPANHPSGSFWFHPHIHGIALNQVSEGLAGIITIGNAGDYARGDAVATPFPEPNIRHLILKDIQVMAKGSVGFDSGPQKVANGEVLNQEDPGFCTQSPDPSEQRLGSCPGQADSYPGGKWYFTVSGQQYPTISINGADGEIWRLTNASGSLSYDLQLQNDATQAPMAMQLLAIDGVSVNLPQDTVIGHTVRLLGARFKLVDCPATATVLRSKPVCVNELVMMPSSRAELWVTYRDGFNRVARAPNGATGTFKMVGLTMGSGDAWPAVDLAKVQFSQTGARAFTRDALDVRGDALASFQQAGIFAEPVPHAAATVLPANCSALAPGHRRRIFFGFSDVTTNNTFALGYEELDEKGNVVPGTSRPPTQFDPSQPTVCLPLGYGQTPVVERWELVQLSTENHNFHIHQTKFRIVKDAAAGTGILEDNVPLGVSVPGPAIADAVANAQNGVCIVDQWRSGQCQSLPVVIDISFSQLGEFVYHCHILEHEDGGMMARIQVVPSPYGSTADATGTTNPSSFPWWDQEGAVPGFSGREPHVVR